MWNYLKSWFVKPDPVKEQLREVRKKLEKQLKENTENERSVFMDKLNGILLEQKRKVELDPRAPSWYPVDEDK